MKQLQLRRLHREIDSISSTCVRSSCQKPIKAIEALEQRRFLVKGKVLFTFFGTAMPPLAVAYGTDSITMIES